MLRKRGRTHQKDQNMVHPISDSIPESQFDILGQKLKPNSFFNVPGLFVGLSPKVSEYDSVRSPTSPLDFRVFSSLTNPFRSPKSPHEGHQKSWDCSKVGLGIIDSLDDSDDSKQSGKIFRSSDSKNILFGPQMRIKTPNFQNRNDSFEAPNSLPENYGVGPRTQIKKPSINLQMGNSDFLFSIKEKNLFEPGKILSCSMDSGRSGSNLTNFTNHSTKLSSGNFGSNPVSLSPQVSSPPQVSGGNRILGNSLDTKMNSLPVFIGSAHDFVGSLSASEIELSEDYTCVRTYGPNPKTTHIFGDCILECHHHNSTNLTTNEEQKIQLPLAMSIKCSEIPTPYPSSDFLSFCYSCNKKLEGEDIYMYRGEKAFCSWGCRSKEILIHEATEKTINAGNCEELSETTMFILT